MTAAYATDRRNEDDALPQQSRVESARTAPLQLDVYCPETLTVYEFFGCHYHGLSCQKFRDVTILSADTLAERYEQTMSRVEQIKRVGYLVKVEWKCEFDDARSRCVRVMSYMGVEMRPCVSTTRHGRI